MDFDIFDNILKRIHCEAEAAYTDFEQYKVDYLFLDPEDVCESLPQDDYRYGLERAIDIIIDEIKNLKKVLT